MSEVIEKRNEHNGDTWFEVIVNPDRWYEATWLGCKYCHDTYKFVGVDDDEGYDISRNIQDTLPNLEPEYRELFISGICPKCWDKMIGDEDEDEEEN